MVWKAHSSGISLLDQLVVGSPSLPGPLLISTGQDGHIVIWMILDWQSPIQLARFACPKPVHVSGYVLSWERKMLICSDYDGNLTCFELPRLETPFNPDLHLTRPITSSTIPEHQPGFFADQDTQFPQWLLSTPIIRPCSTLMVCLLP